MSTYALIPGGGGDPWEWHRLVLELAARGHEALPIRLPADDDSAGWTEYADAVVDKLGDRRDVILVAASMGGFTAPIVSTKRPVELLVLLNAMIPVPGETFNTWWSNTDSGSARREYHASIGLEPDRGRRRRRHLLPRRAGRAQGGSAGAEVAGSVDDAVG